MREREGERVLGTCNCKRCIETEHESVTKADTCLAGVNLDRWFDLVRSVDFVRFFEYVCGIKPKIDDFVKITHRVKSKKSSVRFKTDRFDLTRSIFSVMFRFRTALTTVTASLTLARFHANRQISNHLKWLWFGGRFSSFLVPHRSSVIPNFSVSETLIRTTHINLNASEISISASVNQQNSVLPILRCCSTTTTSSSVVSTNVDVVAEKLSPGTRIFVKGLPQSTAEGFLLKAFSRFGEVNRVKITTDKKLRQSLGFAYVWFSSEESAQLAMKEMDGKFFWGRFINVTIARPEAPTSQVKVTPYRL